MPITFSGFLAPAAILVIGSELVFEAKGGRRHFYMRDEGFGERIGGIGENANALQGRQRFLQELNTLAC